MNWSLILTTFSQLYLHLVCASICGNHEYDLGVKCCRKCPPGFGVTSQCSKDTDTSCELCTHGENFSSSHSHQQQCQSCSECEYNAHVVHSCNVTHDTQCECNQEFYWDGETCRQCDLCPHGWGASRQCISHANTICRKCPAGTYSGVLSSTLGCIVCSVCREEQILMQECTAIQDTLCIDKEFPRQHRPKSSITSDATDTSREDQSAVIPVYCAILGALVLGLLVYVVFKQRRNKKSTGIQLSSDTKALTADEHQIKMMEMKIQDIPSSKRREIESFLDLRRSDQRDWRGLAHELGFSHSKIVHFEKKGKEKHGPTRHILSELNKRNHNVSVGRIVNALQTIGRFDVIQILLPSNENNFKLGELV